jgi:hypothetical protein
MRIWDLKNCVRSKIFTAVKMWIVVFRIVTPFSLVDGYQSFGGTYLPEDGDDTSRCVSMLTGFIWIMVGSSSGLIYTWL